MPAFDVDVHLYPQKNYMIDTFIFIRICSVENLKVS